MSKKPSIEDFKKNAANFAQEVANKKNGVGAQTPLADITKAFKKNRNEVVIGEKTFMIKKFGIRQQMDLVPILGDTLFVPITAVLSEEGTVDFSKAMDALVVLFTNLQGDQFFNLASILLQETSLSGKPVDIETDFEDLPDVISLITSVFELHYDVFSKCPGMLKMLEWGNKFKSFQQ